MSVIQTLGVFAGIPVAVIAVIVFVNLFVRRQTSGRTALTSTDDSWSYSDQLWVGTVDITVPTTPTGPSDRRGGAHGNW